MPDYAYTARTPDGKLVKDRIRMKDEKTLAEYLKGRGLMLTSSKSLDKKSKFSIQNMLKGMSKVPIVQKIFFTQNLSIMVKTGFPLAQALQTLAKQTTNKFFQEVITEIQHDIEAGISFSNALQKHPKVFSEVFINMIAAGEASGKLDEILINLTTQLKKDHAIMAKVKSAMMYPLVVITAMGGIGIIMLVTVIPQLTSIFTESGMVLPLPTRILIGFSDLITHQGVYILLAAFILVPVFLRFKKTYKGKLYIHKMLLTMPLISGIIKKINITRFTRTLSSLLKTDIPIVQTLQIISKTLSNIYYKEAMIDASEKVKKGISIVKSLEEKPKLFPPIVTQMINIGEESGTLDSIAESMAVFYEEDVDQTMAGLSAIIEPILMLILGVAVAFMALSVLMPMYGLVEAI
ncbi:MAG: type II secretion system F family protein [Patescibacteria group bacterium]|nr:type II secretion system F family protein [Patescibacteria group bacterium]MDD5715106.1 type II secretion system F family protein [Patescibacteria group bacterium]